MRVLLCDDEPSIRLLFRTAFERIGATVVEAIDGEDCILRAEIQQPDLVILDLMMPRLDGMATLPGLRAVAPGAAVFLVSAHASHEILQQGLAWGADGCFDKLGFLDHLPELLSRLGVTV